MAERIRRTRRVSVTPSSKPEDDGITVQALQRQLLKTIETVNDGEVDKVLILFDGEPMTELVHPDALLRNERDLLLTHEYKRDVTKPVLPDINRFVIYTNAPIQIARPDGKAAVLRRIQKTKLATDDLLDQYQERLTSKDRIYREIKKIKELLEDLRSEYVHNSIVADLNKKVGRLATRLRTARSEAKKVSKESVARIKTLEHEINRLTQENTNLACVNERILKNIEEDEAHPFQAPRGLKSTTKCLLERLSPGDRRLPFQGGLAGI